MFPIPNEWKSRRQVIIETYFEVRSPAKVAQILGKNPRYIRRVIKAYREYLHDEGATDGPPDLCIKE